MIFLLAAPLAEAACPDKGQPADPGRWVRRGSPPIETRSVRLRFRGGATARMRAVRLHPGAFRVRLHWRESSQWFTPVDLRALGRKLGAVLLLNAGYYDASGRPLGFFRSGGKVYNSRVLYQGRDIALHFGALFTVGAEDGAPNVVARGAFRDRGVAEAFQAGPLLVKDGKPAGGLARYREYLRAARRSIIGLDAQGRLFVLVSESETRGVSWCELQEFLVLPEARGGPGLRVAMNLDGGSSSQLWVQAGEREVSIPGRPAPTFVVVAPRR